MGGSERAGERAQRDKPWLIRTYAASAMTSLVSVPCAPTVAVTRPSALVTDSLMAARDRCMSASWSRLRR